MLLSRSGFYLPRGFTNERFYQKSIPFLPLLIRLRK